METILVTGGTGMIGKALSKSLAEKGYKVVVLSRQPGKYPERVGISYANWDIKKQIIDEEAIINADHIIHLAGAGVADKRWTSKRKQEIADSRIQSGKLLVKALHENNNNVKSVISASGIGWYGPDAVIPNPSPFNETDPAFDDFLGQTCKQWEESLAPVIAIGKRLVILRCGIVISPEGGAMEEFRKPMHMGIATILGSGKQIISWIHIEDLVKMYTTAIENKSMEGVYNAVSPQPVSNKELVLTLARARGKFYIPFHVPSFILKTAMGEMSIEILKSATVSADKIKTAGFNFQFPEINKALDNTEKLNRELRKMK
jgi:uncharacterized protein